MSTKFSDVFFASAEQTIVDVLRYRALSQPDQLAFTFLPDGETEGEHLTYAELERRARAIAAQLQALGLSGERCLLLYPSGLDYVAAFFGCLYADIVAVTAYPPRNKRNTPRIKAIWADAQVACALTTTAILSNLQSLLNDKTDFSNLQWLTTDNLPHKIEDSWQKPLINTDTLAFLQYTSGSTGTPKGVMLSHGNLLHNAAMTYKIMAHSPSSKFVSWLPIYHDMGLIGGILQPLYGGFPCILMPPPSFLQRPYRWLQAISRYQGTTSGAPNFAYELCIHKITPEQRETLDLSSWDVAFNGAEPIRQDTLERFGTTFESCGFRKQAFYPCYGMAEATLMVSGGQKTAPPASKTIFRDALEKNQIVEVSAENEETTNIVGCGQTLPEQQIVIADPETFTKCLPDRVGEIWVSGSSVGRGYWNRPSETEQIFQAYLSDTGEGPFLRTGDLGFLQNGELFVTGRVKDLIIIRGRNLYPQDIELTAERSHPSLRPSSAAAFSVEVNNEERLVVVQELEFRQKPNIEEVTAAIRQAVVEEHEVQVYGVVLIKPGSIPKTSSGKIQRRACRAQFLADNLNVIGSNILESTDFVGTANHLNREALLALPRRECQPLLESYLQNLVAQVLSIALSQVNTQQPLTTLGLDSLKVFELKNQIEVDLGIAVSIADFFEDSSIVQLANKIIPQLKKEGSIPFVPLAKVEKVTDVHPLSFAQARLWFLDQLEKGNPAYNISFGIRLQGLLQVRALEQSLNEIVRRHEALRTTFSTVEGQPIQRIAPSLTIPLPVVDCQKLPELGRESEVRSLMVRESQQPFDLTQEPLFRAKLVRLGQQEHILLLTMHHIISDEWSVEVLIREMAALYKAFLAGNPSPLPELPIQYSDFAYWQRQSLQGERLENQLSYWKKQLDGSPAVLQLPTDRPRPPVQTYRGAHQSLTLPKPLSEAIENLSRQEGVTLFMLLLAAFQTLLYRYTGQEDIPVGSPIAYRNRDEIKRLIGFFVNTIVLRADLRGNPSFVDLLGRLRQVALEAYAHQDLPFEQLVEELQPERDASYSPLFQVMFTLRNAPQIEEIPDLVLSPFKVDNQTAQFDLSLSIEMTERGLSASFEYNTDLFDAATIARMLGHFQNLLEGIVANPQASLSDLPLLTPAEQHQLLVEWNDTKTDYPLDRCIHQLFEAQVEQTPDAVAIVFGNEQLTYRELNQRANQLAHYLNKLGVKPEVLVGICVERSLEMIVGLLGILKAGGAYVPLDPAYPQERLSIILEDAQASVLLTQQRLVETLPEQGTELVCLDASWEVIARHSQENRVSEVGSNNLAYVIYTSGSTGRPKGVAIEHHSTVAMLSWANKLFAVEDLAGVLASTSICFDLSVFELFVPLSFGGKVILAENGLHLPTLSAAKKVTLINTVPSVIAELLRNGGIPDSVRTINIAGEPLPNKLVQELYQLDTVQQVFNLYGPSEDTTYSTFALVEKDVSEIPPIGRPIANTQVYLLDRHLQPVPIGLIGELHISGEGLARGYLNQPELTIEKFIPNLYRDEPGARLYKTGDLARYLPNGNIEYLGRIDHQVKLRGFRIELGEIEALLTQHPGVQQAVVLVREDVPDNKRIVAYVVGNLSSDDIPNQKQVPTTSELRNFLKEKLPEYMLPSAFVMLEAMPLTPNGKVDRRALPAPEGRPELEEAYVRPQTEAEQIIAAVWQEILQLEKVGINDNFFSLGGHSLLLVKIQAKLNEIFEQKLSVIDIFKYPTIQTLAEYISQKHQGTNPAFRQIQGRASQQKEAIKKQKETIKKQKQLMKQQGRKANG
ncbi:MAG: amino acid adenylation domain-containing protein [Oscillatoria sp. PMC 1051.18]|nr:amino acid adenylation domain-containing protein [Oscillatoria sp. PMC 1050.18]MEC5028407.1 amino acid adenylation domain-containing protein [Oscillatoria sp. PMC 1051.18]